MSDTNAPEPATPNAVDAAAAKLLTVVNPPKRVGSNTALITLASSVAAVVLALAISGVLLAVTGKNPFTAYSTMIDIGMNTDKLLETLDRATPLIFAATAVAIGFKMNLFNIGVESQFLVGMFAVAVIGSRFSTWQPLNLLLVCLIGMVFGALWASIAAFLKVKRGVNEVISTIMLNSIALALIDYLFNEHFQEPRTSGSADIRTKQLPESAWFPNLFDGRVTGMLFVALFVAFAYWVIVFKSRFGFRLRASGANPIAARTAGIGASRMIVVAMLLSGAIAGLAGLPYLLGTGHSYGSARPDGFGFDGIAVALLGRNHPVGIVLAALLYAFLDAVAGPLQLKEIPQSIVLIIQAITLLSVVIVNEAVGRWHSRRTTERAAAAIAVSDGFAQGAVPA